MKNEKLYQETVDILLDAFNNNTLQHTNCYACAVGNIIAARNNYVYDETCGRKKWMNQHVYWGIVFLTVNRNQRIRSEYYAGEAKHEIDSTGYSVGDLAKIEYAFETADKGSSDREYMLNGLTNVLKTLTEIHESEEEKFEEDKVKFETIYNKQLAYEC